MILVTFVLYFFLLAIFLVQQYFLLPLEAELVGAEVAAVVSLVFLPQGAKVLAAVISGYLALIPIFLAQFTSGLLYDLAPLDAATAAALATLALCLPLIAIRWYTGSLLKQSSINLFWMMMVLGLSSSVLNSTFIALYRGYGITEMISMRFLLGDLLGTALLFCGLMLFRGLVARFSIQQLKKTLPDA